MKIVLITPPEDVPNEISMLHDMFGSGLSILHLRKPDYDRRQMAAYLSGIQSQYLNRIVVHSHHLLLEEFPLRGIHLPSSLRCSAAAVSYATQMKAEIESCTLSVSCHSVADYDQAPVISDYAFLSPIFDSISKPGYRAAFSLNELAPSLNRRPANWVALGGCQREHLPLLHAHGFSGAAFLGAVWQSLDPVKECSEIQMTANSRSKNKNQGIV